MNSPAISITEVNYSSCLRPRKKKNKKCYYKRSANSLTRSAKSVRKTDSRAKPISPIVKIQVATKLYRLNLDLITIYQKNTENH